MSYDTPLIAAVRLGREADVAASLAIGVDVDETMTDGSGRTALSVACEMGHAEIASKLLAAKANVDAWSLHTGYTPMYDACRFGHLGCVQLLSSYGASRTFSALGHTAERIATFEGHHDIAAWLVTSRFWTPLHHLEVLTPERTLALLRAGTDINADDADEEISFSLQQASDPLTAAAAAKLEKLLYLRTSSRLTVKHLKKYLFYRMKLQMPMKVEILCRGNLLGDEHSLDLIWRALWRDCVHSLPQNERDEHQSDDLVLEFRLLPLEGSTEAAAAAELTAPARNAEATTPLRRAKDLCMTGRAEAGSAAHILLEWGAPWSRHTHHFYPPAVRARVREVLLRPCALFFYHKDHRMATEMVDAFEASLVKYMVASAEWRKSVKP